MGWKIVCGHFGHAVCMRWPLALVLLVSSCVSPTPQSLRWPRSTRFPPTEELAGDAGSLERQAALLSLG